LGFCLDDGRTGVLWIVPRSVTAGKFGHLMSQVSHKG